MDTNIGNFPIFLRKLDGTKSSRNEVLNLYEKINKSYGIDVSDEVVRLRSGKEEV